VKQTLNNALHSELAGWEWLSKTTEVKDR